MVSLDAVADKWGSWYRRRRNVCGATRTCCAPPACTPRLRLRVCRWHHYTGCLNKPQASHGSHVAPVANTRQGGRTSRSQANPGCVRGSSLAYAHLPDRLPPPSPPPPQKKTQPRRRWVSILLLLALLFVTFGFLLTAAERFFCPALEYIADRLKLPPAVAGATLLSFGNGAPDVFTQLAAVRQVRGRGARAGLGVAAG